MFFSRRLLSWNPHPHVLYTFHQNPAMIEQGSLIYFSILDSQNLCKERRDLQPSGYDFEQD